MININEIKKRLNDHYAARAEIADCIENDRRAMAILTGLETAQQADEDVIWRFVEICGKLGIRVN